MATLYDLELQESNNFIHALIANGSTPALKLILDQKKQAASMGEAGKELLKQIEDDKSEMGKSFKRLQSLEKDIQESMKKVKLAPTVAKEAESIFNKSPETLKSLPEDQQKIVNEYWLKKKSVIVLLLQKGYTHEELFS